MEVLKRVFDSEIKGIDEKEKTITAYVSTDARDRMDESVSPDGVDLSRYRKNPVVLWAHDYSTPPIGKSVWIKKDGNGLISKMQFADTPFAQEIFSLYKGGFMKAFSIGFIPKETEQGDGEKKPRWTYKKSELLEYSAVPVPANPEALMMAVKQGILVSDDVKKSLNYEEVIEKEEDPELAELRDLKTKHLSRILLLEEENSDLDGQLAETKHNLFTIEQSIGKYKYEIYQLKQMLNQRLSEKAVEDMLKQFDVSLSRAIRKAQGKVD